MSYKRQPSKVIKKIFKLKQHFFTTIKKQIICLLRTLFISKKRRSPANAGFVLPTVAMVALVVVLLTTAILFRSFERSKNASNVRVNEVVLQAATPALERAKAKISELFADPTLPRAVPSNTTLYKTLIAKLNNYTLGDETQISLVYDLDEDDSIDAVTSNTALENQEKLETAWKFPVDTDNNGKFDSFILYGIYFRNPPQTGVNPTRTRKPLDARTPPMLQARAGGDCDTTGDTSASLVGSSGWYKVQTGELKKSFFTYAVTVPITDIASLDNKYEKYQGNRGFSALEMQQDRSQLPITNNAVVYEDDLDITPGPRFRLNGRIFSNSNLFTGKNSENITLFQVSSPQSCYYERENGKIVVGGNVATNSPISDTNKSGVQIHLFKENDTPTTNKTLASESTKNAPNQIAFNSQAYAQRIDLLVNAQALHADTTDPQEVKDNKTRRLNNDPSLDAVKVRREELEIYFRKRTRRVPFNEVNYGNSGIIKSGSTEYTVSDVLQGYNSTGSSNALRPPDAWIYPTDTNTTLQLDTAELPAIDPDKVDTTPIEEKELGDRILAGNNLPELRWDDTKKEFVGQDDPQDITGVKWKNSTKTRTRTTQVRQLADLGVTGRDGFWEIATATPRTNALDVVGGLRVIAGAGLYQRKGSFMETVLVPPAPTNDPSTTDINESLAPVVWPDTMPMLGFKNNDPSQPLLRGDLVMRASVVYHYNKDAYDPQNTTPDYYQTPIACVSSYYNPTNKKSATTNTYDPKDATTAEASNNGITYKASTTKAADITRGNALTNGLFTAAVGADDVTNKTVTLLERLKYQANLVFPNGRLVNSLLRQALVKATTKNLTLSEQAALDSSICAIEIADGTLTKDATVIPNDAIKETTFLDARQIKSVDKPDTTTGLTTPTGLYDLEIEQRQPLEIRATVIDLDLLRKTSVTGTWANEYLLPNSGVIYATRDDAQPDRSDPASTNVSATDYKLDPNRRPNAIMLIKGKDLSRQNNYRAEEKGLILATNLPVYVKGDQGEFNKHDKQEFLGGDVLTTANWDTQFYARVSTNRDPNFACRPSDPRLPKCTTGETWRPAAVIADAVTLLSENFREGYRNEGNYDLRNNQTDIKTADTTKDAKKVRDNRKENGFWDNNFITSFDKLDDNNSYYIADSYYSGTPDGVNDPVERNSSYLNNFVTPIQRRGDFPEYVMEMCFKLPVSECKKDDWYVGYDNDANNIIDPTTEKLIKSSALPANAAVGNLVAGTTARPAKSGFERYARRVAFRRNSSDQLADTDGITALSFPLTKSPIALGIKSSKVDLSGTVPDKNANSLWFATTTDTANPPADATKIEYNNTGRLFYQFPNGADAFYEPLLEPVVQLQVTTKAPENTKNYASSLAKNSKKVSETRWLSKAKATTFNLIIAAGDTPARVGNTTSPQYEINGGLHNFVRFLENWEGVDANISGSFIQFKRSIYATAPFQTLVRSGPDVAPAANSIFTRTLDTDDTVLAGYKTDSTKYGEAPYYLPPNRNWGFDVGLLSQNPDLFAQRFVIPSTDPPNEYYREVGRDDRWVQTLLCAVQSKDKADGFGTADSKYGTDLKYALPANQRPKCPVD